MSAVSRLFPAAVAALLIAGAARAQGNPWFGEDALVLSRGMVRLGLAPTFTRYDERYRVDGQAEPLGADLTTDTLGAAELSVLAPLESQLPSLTGLSDVRVSLGRMRVSRDASILTMPLAGEIGIGGRLSLGVIVPIVRTLSHVVFSPNPGLNEGNVGINPAIDDSAARDQNQALLDQFASAVEALEELITACEDPANPDPRCPAARTPEALELASGAAMFAGELGDRLRVQLAVRAHSPTARSTRPSAVASRPSRSRSPHSTSPTSRPWGRPARALPAFPT